MKKKIKLIIDRRRKLSISDYWLILPNGDIMTRDSVLGFDEKNFQIVFSGLGIVPFSEEDFYEIANKFFLLKEVEK